MLLDNTGDDAHRHAAFFINVGDGKGHIILLSGHSPVEAGMGNRICSVVQSDIYNAFMHIGNLAGIFALDTALLQIGTVRIFRYAFYIRLDCDVLDIIPIHFKDFDKDFITDRKTVVGITDPVPG